MLTKALQLWSEDVNQPLYTSSGAGLKAGVIGGELAPELLGVGYIIGPRISAIMVAGGVLAYLVLVPLIALFGEHLDQPLAPAKEQLIRQMSVGELRNNYILYIGAGAVAAGGIISMLRALPLIIRSLSGALRDLAGSRRGDQRSPAEVPRSEQDLSLKFVLLGSLGLVVALAASPSLGLGLSMARPGRCADDRVVRFLVRDRLHAADRRDRLVVEPDLRHDRGHVAADLPDLPGAGAHGQDRRRSRR